jgi:hypothetical protein
MTESAGGYQGRLPRSDEDDPEGADFAVEHADVSHAWEMEGGPEGLADEDVPHGLAGHDATEAER